MWQQGQQCYLWHAVCKMTRTDCRGLADLGAKDKYAGLPAACAAGLQCAPFVIPSAWAASQERMAEELAAYSINLESSVRKASDQACANLQLAENAGAAHTCHLCATELL
jgi:hypothetical protein